MTDRKLTCAACKSAVTKGDIAHSDLEFGGVIKAGNQPEYTTDADTDLVATVGTLDEYTPMVRTSGNQTISGTKKFNTAPQVNGLTGTPEVRSFRNIIAVNGPGTNYLGATLTVQYNENGTTLVYVQVRNSNGTIKNVVLGSGDVIL